MERKEAVYKGLQFTPVYFEDTSLTSPDYFQITEFPSRLTAGKNLFKLRGHPTNLRVGGALGIEVLDYNGDPVYTEVVDFIDDDKSRAIAIYIYEDSSPGDCTITLIAEAASINNQSIPTEWQGRPNIRWSRSVPVNPNVSNVSEIIFENVPDVTVNEIIGVQLDRRYPNGTQFPVYNTGSVRYFYYNNQPAIELQGGTFNNDMSNGTITVPNPISPSPTPSFTIPTTAYISAIKKILTPTTALLDTEYTLYSSQSIFPHTYNEFLFSTYSISYEATPTYVETENSQSFAFLQISNLQPATGDVARIKVFTNNNGTVGTWELVNDVELNEIELFISSTSSLYPDKSIGIFTSQSIINTYWDAHTYQNGIEITPTTLTWVTSSLSNAMLISSSIDISNKNSVQVAQVKSAYQGIFKANASYKVTIDALGTRNGINNPKLAIYLSGSSFYQDPTDYFNQEFSKTFGKRIGEITVTSDNQRFDDYIINFEADYNGTGVLLLVVEDGEWQIADVRTTTDNETGYTPDYTRLKTLINTTHKIGNQISFKVEYYNVNGERSKQISYVYNKDWAGGNRYIDGNFSMLTGSLYVADSLNSGVAISGYPNAGWVRSLGYEGFAAGFPGFLLWSGSALPGSAGTKGGIPYSGVGLELYANTASYFRYSTSPSEIDVRTDKFFFGNPSSSFISGSNGAIEISASNFHLTRQGNVTASNALFKGVALANVIRDKTVVVTAANSGSYLQNFNASDGSATPSYRVVMDGSLGGEIVRRVRINCTLLRPIGDFKLPSIGSTERLDFVLETAVSGVKLLDVFTTDKIGIFPATYDQLTLDENASIILTTGGSSGANLLAIAGTEHPFNHEFKGQLKVSSSGEYYRHGNRLFNYGQFYDMTIQSASIANTPYAMKFNSSSAYTNFVSIVNNGSGFPTRIRTQFPGLYNLQFSAQLFNNANENIDYIIWFRQNGTDIINSATNIEVTKAAGASGRAVASWNFMYETAATNEYIEIVWAASTTNGQLLYEQSSSTVPHPAIPSVIATVTQIA